MPRSKAPQPGSQRMPSESVFYDRIVPILIAVLGIVMLAIIIIAAGVLLGYVSWR